MSDLYRNGVAKSSVPAKCDVSLIVINRVVHWLCLLLASFLHCGQLLLGLRLDLGTAATRVLLAD